LRRLGRDVEGNAAYETAITLTDNAAERDFLYQGRQSLASRGFMAQIGMAVPAIGLAFAVARSAPRSLRRTT
jgi:hypothetical protein